MESIKSDKCQCPLCFPMKEERSKTEYVFDYLFITPENRCPFCLDFKTPGEICAKCIEVVQARCTATFILFGTYSVPQCRNCNSEKDHPVCMICLTDFKRLETKDPVILSLRQKNAKLRKMWSKRTVEPMMQ